MATKKKLDKKLKKQKLEGNVRRWLAEAMRKFHLDEWELSIEFIPDMEDEMVIMEVNLLPEYMKTEVEVNFKVCMETGEKELRLACYHEAAHMLLSELVKLTKSRWVTQEQARVAEEKLCQILAHIAANK